MELITRLLERRLPATRDEIFADVTAYGLEQRLAASDVVVGPSRARESARRKFERDKDELRELGLAIETVRIPAGGNTAGQVGYVLGPGSERPCRVIVSETAEGGVPEADAWLLTAEDVSRIDACLARLIALPGHPLHAAATSAQREINDAGVDPELGAGGPTQLMPQEQLPVQVALVEGPYGLP